MQHQSSDHPTGVSTSGVPTSRGPNAVATARRRKADAAVSLRLAGATWAEIAEALGYPTPRQALVATERALARQLSEPEDREKMRRLAGARLERLLRTIWPKAIDPEHPEQMAATTKAREIIAQHAKLFGLDAPTEIVVHNPTQAEIEAWVATMLNAEAPRPVEYDIITGSVVDTDTEAG